MLSLGVQYALAPPLTFGLLWIIHKTGDMFFYWACIFTTIVSLIMIVLFPLVIMPLFNKFSPFEDNVLKKDIEALAKSINFPLTKLEVIDGSKRSGHSNAFFYGLGKFKKIVLFDTLLEQHLGMKGEALNKNEFENKRN